MFDYFPQWFDDNHLHGHDNWTHVRPMADLLCNKEGELLVDYVGRLENLKESFAEICRLSGLPEDSKLLHSNPSRVRNPDTGELLEAGVKIPWKDYYDKETVGFVQRYYSKDFELFDYPNTF